MNAGYEVREHEAESLQCASTSTKNKSMKETAVSHSYSNAHSRHKLMAEKISKELGDGSSQFVRQLKIVQT